MSPAVLPAVLPADTAPASRTSDAPILPVPASLPSVAFGIYAANPQFLSPQPGSIPAQSLVASGFTLFCLLFDLALSVLNILRQRLDRMSLAASAAPYAKLALCFGRLIKIQYTLQRDPGRITPRQLLRLSKVSSLTKRLMGLPINFTPWTSLSPEELAAASPLPSKTPARPPKIHSSRPATIRPETSHPAPRTPMLHSPAASLAFVFKTLAGVFDSLPTPPPTPTPLPTPTTTPVSTPISTPSTQSTPSTLSMPSISPSSPRSTLHPPPFPPPPP